MRRKRWWGLTGLLLVMVLILSSCGKPRASRATTNNQPIKVVATLNFYGEAAQAILGDQGHVTSVINSPSIDPESYEPDIKTAKQVAAADVVIENGLGYDSWMARLVAANGRTPIQTLSLGQLLGRSMGDNPHLWSDPNLMLKMTQRLVRRFSQLDPAHATDFKRRGAAYARRLAVLPQLAQQIKKRAAGQSVAVSEPVFDLALTAMGYTVSDHHFAQSIEEDSDPTPADITTLQRQIRRHQIAFFVENTQNSSKNVATMVQLAHQYHVPVVQVTETKPVHQSYATWMAGQYRQVLKIQQEARTRS